MSKDTFVELCDFQLREKYGLLGKAIRTVSLHYRQYPEDAVLAALRAAEKRRNEEVAVLATMLKVALESKRQLLGACEAALAVLGYSRGKMAWRADACVSDAQSILDRAIAK